MGLLGVVTYTEERLHAALMIQAGRAALVKASSALGQQSDGTCATHGGHEETGRPAHASLAAEVHAAGTDREWRKLTIAKVPLRGELLAQAMNLHHALHRQAKAPYGRR